MKIENDLKIEENNKKTSFFHNRPKGGLFANNIATMRSVIILSKDEEKDALASENPSQFSI